MLPAGGIRRISMGPSRFMQNSKNMTRRTGTSLLSAHGIMAAGHAREETTLGMSISTALHRASISGQAYRPPGLPIFSRTKDHSQCRKRTHSRRVQTNGGLMTPGLQGLTSHREASFSTKTENSHSILLQNKVRTHMMNMYPIRPILFRTGQGQLSQRTAAGRAGILGSPKINDLFIFAPTS